MSWEASPCTRGAVCSWTCPRYGAFIPYWVVRWCKAMPARWTLSSNVLERSRADKVRFRSESKFMSGDSVLVPHEVSFVKVKDYGPREETGEQDYLGDVIQGSCLRSANRLLAWATLADKANAAQMFGQELCWGI